MSSVPIRRGAGVAAWQPPAVHIDSAVLLAYSTRTVWALAVLVLTLVVGRVCATLIRGALRRQRAHANVTILVGNLAQLAILILGILGILAIYTRDSFGWILASFSVVGVVLGLSLQDILKNFFAGIWVLIERPFLIGDRIEVNGQSGVVETIAFRTTLLRTDDGDQLIVPNGVFMTSSVINHVGAGTEPAGQRARG